MNRRNLVIVIAHGLRSDALSDEGRWPLRTPAMVELAGRGLRLVAQSCCTADPGGAVSLWTGLHGRQHGVLREGQRLSALDDSLPRWLKDGGYYVAGVGELSAVSSLLDDFVPVAPVEAVEADGCAYLGSAAARGHVPMLAGQRRQRLRRGPFLPDRLMLEPTHDIDGFIAEQAVRKLLAMPIDRPWALIVSFTGPGNELPPPAMYDSLVEPGELRGGFSPADLSQIDALGEAAYPRYLLQNLDEAAVTRVRADYLGRVSLIDHGVGRLHEALRDRKDGHRVWSMVASDRGVLLGESGLVGHRSALAAAVDTPLIVAPPPGGSFRGEDDEVAVGGLFSVADVAPTVAALAGVDAPPGLAGRSLLPLLSGDPLLPSRDAVLCEFGERVVLETASHKAVFDVRDGRALAVFDLVRDPDETRNVVDQPRGLDVLDSLRARLSDALLPLRSA